MKETRVLLASGPRVESSRARVVSRLGIVVGATVPALLLAEVLARFTGVAALSLTDPIYRRSSAPGVVYEFRPGARGYTWGRTWVEVNSLGLRGPEVDRVKPPGVYRIGVFGDSATFGQGVSEEATYARVLERTNRGVQVLNFGVPSYSIANIVSTFAEKGVPLDLDAAVLAPISEDYGLHRAHTTDDYGYPVHAASPIKPGPLKNLLRHVHLAYLVRDAWWNMTGAGTPEIRALHENSGDDALATETWDRAARELARFVAVARANGVVPIYMAIGSAMPPVLERLVSDSGFMKLVAMQPIAASYPPEALKVSSRDDHPSALYHQLVAKELGRVVSELRQKTVADGKSTKEN